MANMDTLERWWTIIWWASIQQTDLDGTWFVERTRLGQVLPKGVWKHLKMKQGRETSGINWYGSSRAKRSHAFNYKLASAYTTESQLHMPQNDQHKRELSDARCDLGQDLVDSEDNWAVWPVGWRLSSIFHFIMGPEKYWKTIVSTSNAFTSKLVRFFNLTWNLKAQEYQTMAIYLRKSRLPSPPKKWVFAVKLWNLRAGDEYEGKHQRCVFFGWVSIAEPTAERPGVETGNAGWCLRWNIPASKKTIEPRYSNDDKYTI